LSDEIATVKIDDNFKFDIESGRYETEHAWLELKIKKDSRRGDFYIDGLMGSKGKKAHVHFGLNADQSYRFLLPRGSLHTFGRRAVDSKRGVLEDSVLWFKPGEGKHRATFTVVIDEPTRKIRVLFTEVKLESNTE
jgi:hypothetical protein